MGGRRRMREGEAERCGGRCGGKQGAATHAAEGLPAGQLVLVPRAGVLPVAQQLQADGLVGVQCHQVLGEELSNGHEQRPTVQRGVAGRVAPLVAQLVKVDVDMGLLGPARVAVGRQERPRHREELVEARLRRLVRTSTSASPALAVRSCAHERVTGVPLSHAAASEAGGGPGVRGPRAQKPPRTGGSASTSNSSRRRARACSPSASAAARFSACACTRPATVVAWRSRQAGSGGNTYSCAGARVARGRAVASSSMAIVRRSVCGDCVRRGARGRQKNRGPLFSFYMARKMAIPAQAPLVYNFFKLYIYAFFYFTATVRTTCCTPPAAAAPYCVPPPRAPSTTDRSLLTAAPRRAAAWCRGKV
jgi:hypothetical protein